MQALHDSRTSNLLMWASRYNLFVLWSADRLHPWDSLARAGGIAAVLEIGKAEYDEEVSFLRAKHVSMKEHLGKHHNQCVDRLSCLNPQGEGHRLAIWGCA